MSIEKLRVFISWSGPQAQIIAEGFNRLLPVVVNAIEPFYSNTQIDKGTRWRAIVEGALQGSICEIACLTPESIDSPWVAFETGAISLGAGGTENAKSRIWTYLLGLDKKDVQLSLYGEYQGTNPTKEETFHLIESINNLSPDAVKPDTLRQRFEGSFWPDFDRAIADAKTKGTSLAPSPTDPEIMSEILRTLRSVQAMQADMPARIEGVSWNVAAAFERLSARLTAKPLGQWEADPSGPSFSIAGVSNLGVAKIPNALSFMEGELKLTPGPINMYRPKEQK